MDIWTDRFLRLINNENIYFAAALVAPQKGIASLESEDRRIDYIRQQLSATSNERKLICPGLSLDRLGDFPDPCQISELQAGAVKVSWSVVTLSPELHAG